jgi:hypothetical protein
MGHDSDVLPPSSAPARKKMTYGRKDKPDAQPSTPEASDSDSDSDDDAFGTLKKKKRKPALMPHELEYANGGAGNGSPSAPEPTETDDMVDEPSHEGVVAKASAGKADIAVKAVTEDDDESTSAKPLDADNGGEVSVKGGEAGGAEPQTGAEDSAKEAGTVASAKAADDLQPDSGADVEVNDEGAPKQPEKAEVLSADTASDPEDDKADDSGSGENSVQPEENSKLPQMDGEDPGSDDDDDVAGGEDDAENMLKELEELQKAPRNEEVQYAKQVLQEKIRKEDGNDGNAIEGPEIENEFETYLKNKEEHDKRQAQLLKEKTSLFDNIKAREQKHQGKSLSLKTLKSYMSEAAEEKPKDDSISFGNLTYDDDDDLCFDEEPSVNAAAVLPSPKSNTNTPRASNARADAEEAGNMLEKLGFGFKVTLSSHHHQS